ETGGHSLMYNVSAYALKLIEGQSFTDPLQHLDDIFPEVYEYAAKITTHADLRKTFALNALVCVDNAAWLLYAHEHGIDNFDEMRSEERRVGKECRGRWLLDGGEKARARRRERRRPGRIRCRA